jgi:hypothetical protein
MIKVFRKIRQKLLEENNMGKYLKYALGEILLVVIGILIALQLNTWKEKRANQVQENNFYLTLLKDLENDQNKMDEQKAFFEHRIEVLTWLLTRSRNPSLPVKAESFGQHVEPLYYNEAAISFDASFDAAKSSGAFDHFSNKELLKKVIQYYSEFVQIENVIAATLGIIEQQLEPLTSSLYKNYLNEQSSDLVIAEGGNQKFYKLLGSIPDNRAIDTEGDIQKFLQKPEVESYLVGDLGRAFHTIAKLEARSRKIDSLKTAINHFLHD